MYDSRTTNGKTVPLWYRRLSAADRDAISQRWSPDWPNSPVDVVIVGAGICGLSTAYQLLRQGRSVVVLDMRSIGAGETGRSTAHVASALDDRYHLLERIHGPAHAALAAQSHTAAIDSVESICASEGIACDFRRVNGYLFAADGGEPELRRELDAARRAGLSVEWLDAAPAPFADSACLRFADQAELDPLAYVLGLARAVQYLGGRIYSRTRMRRLEHHAHREHDHEVRVHVDGRMPIVTRDVIVATNTPVNDLFALHTKQAPYRSYVLALDIPAGSIERGLYWDTLDPYHYVRLAGEDLLIVGGEDHKVGQSAAPEASWSRLEAWTRERFRNAGEVRFRWSGQIQEPDDGLAFIGRNPGNSSHVFIATGDSGNGITHGALAGILLSDLICGKDNPWAAVYDPSRKLLHPAAIRDFVHENANVARHYAHWLLPERARHTLQPGEGRVIRPGIVPIALYVDEAGTEHRHSAVCPHLGCIVAWNRAEKSWDCPCHGSRFDPYGKLLTGPSNRDLAQPESAASPPKRSDAAQ
jgi:glycine/D-amino acid oxidase-like deaminating enzyme/nitrite reductase/ring-hydroxylating ferredoxin subunit